MENHNNNPIGVNKRIANWDDFSSEHNSLNGGYDYNQNKHTDSTGLHAMADAVHMVHLNGAAHAHHSDNNFHADRFFDDIDFTYLEKHNTEFFVYKN